jgi:hypothetical protein
MYVWILLVVSAVALQAQGLRTFGVGLSFQWLYPNEVNPYSKEFLLIKIEDMALF